jgi:hypothetical protein
VLSMSKVRRGHMIEQMAKILGEALAGPPPSAEGPSKGDKLDACARAAIREHDYAELSGFFSKHGIGPKTKPSCLVCGKVAERPYAIQHMELPGVVVCLDCANAVRAATVVRLSDQTAESDLDREAGMPQNQREHLP